jgi:hypothetical protein
MTKSIPTQTNSHPTPMVAFSLINNVPCYSCYYLGEQTVTQTTDATDSNGFLMNIDVQGIVIIPQSTRSAHERTRDIDHFYSPPYQGADGKSYQNCRTCMYVFLDSSSPYSPIHQLTGKSIQQYLFGYVTKSQHFEGIPNQTTR